MWIPQTEDEIVIAITSGTLNETSIFDAKRELPAPGKSKDLAKDVAAMATDGGVIIFGIAEDASGRPTSLAPIPLKGAAERVASIVRTSISEPPEISIHRIEAATDSSLGYLIVAVPPSPRAPHMVIVDKDFRYYGRGATGNVPLTEGEVARLYTRRQRWEVDQDALLNEAIKRAPITARDEFAYLHIVIKPIATDEGLLDRACKTDSVPTLLNKILPQTFDVDVFPVAQYDPDFVERVPWHRQLNGWIAYLSADPHRSTHREPDEALDLYINRDGSGYLFCGRAAQRYDYGLLLFEKLLAGLTSRTLCLFGELYKHARYFGPVDIGLAVTGIKGCISSTLNPRQVGSNSRPFEYAEYKRPERTLAASLADNPQEIARRLLMPLVDATTQGNSDPFR